MSKLLLYSTGSEISHYTRFAHKYGIHLSILDCFEDVRVRNRVQHLSQHVTVRPHRTDVQKTISEGKFTSILIDASKNIVRAALVTQAARDARVPYITVVTAEKSLKSVFRKLGAQAVVVAKDSQRAVKELRRVRSFMRSCVQNQKFLTRDLVRQVFKNTNPFVVPVLLRS